MESPKFSSLQTEERSTHARKTLSRSNVIHAKTSCCGWGRVERASLHGCHSKRCGWWVEWGDKRQKNKKPTRETPRLFSHSTHFSFTQTLAVDGNHQVIELTVHVMSTPRRRCQQHRCCVATGTPLCRSHCNEKHRNCLRRKEKKCRAKRELFHLPSQLAKDSKLSNSW